MSNLRFVTLISLATAAVSLSACVHDSSKVQDTPRIPAMENGNGDVGSVGSGVSALRCKSYTANKSDSSYQMIRTIRSMTMFTMCDTDLNKLNAFQRISAYYQCRQKLKEGLSTAELERSVEELRLKINEAIEKDPSLNLDTNKQLASDLKKLSDEVSTATKQGRKNVSKLKDELISVLLSSRKVVAAYSESEKETLGIEGDVNKLGAFVTVQENFQLQRADSKFLREYSPERLRESFQKVRWNGVDYYEPYLLSEHSIMGDVESMVQAAQGEPYKDIYVLGGIFSFKPGNSLEMYSVSSNQFVGARILGVKKMSGEVHPVLQVILVTISSNSSTDTVQVLEQHKLKTNGTPVRLDLSSKVSEGSSFSKALKNMTRDGVDSAAQDGLDRFRKRSVFYEASCQ